MGCGWIVIYLSVLRPLGLQTSNLKVLRPSGLKAFSALDLKVLRLKALGLKAIAQQPNVTLTLGRKYLETLGLGWNHIDVGDGSLVYVPMSQRPVWGEAAYSSRFPNLHTTLWVPAVRPWDIADLPSRWDTGLYARRVVTGHDCFGVACRALRLAGHPVARWRGPVALFEYLNGLEGTRHETHRLLA